MDFHGELSCTTAPLPLHIQSHANTDMQLCAHKLSPVFSFKGNLILVISSWEMDFLLF